MPVHAFTTQEIWVQNGEFKIYGVAYVFDFCGGTVGGNKSDGSNKGMSVLTEASDLAEVLGNGDVTITIEKD